MIKASILGTGAVAKHLFDVFSCVNDVELHQVIGRNETALKAFGKKVPTTADFSKIADADIFIIAVKDDAIATVSNHLRNKMALIVHTSGSASMDTLGIHDRYGVFYPLQTFSQDRAVDMKSVPFCLEAHDATDMALLVQLAGKISENVYPVNSEQRKALHLAAVFVNNFTNHLYHIGQRICEVNGLPFDILYPLIKETTDKIEQLPPYEAQTGPARRGDLETLKDHLGQLKNSDYKEMYEVFNKSIQRLYKARK